MPSTYSEVYDRWRAEPEAFWAEAAEAVHWYRRWNTVLDSSRTPLYRWFPGAEVNTCYNALDRHVINDRGEQVALIHDSPVTGTQRKMTYSVLLGFVARFGGVLRSLGVEKGDRVVIYMPMVPQAVVAMLACARLGAIHSVVFGGFAPAELAARIEDANPKVIVSASCGIEPTRVVEYKPYLDAAIERSSHKPERCIILQRAQATAVMTSPRGMRSPPVRIDARQRFWFNPTLSDSKFFLAALVGMLLTNLCLSTTAQGIVGERERGTYEQMAALPTTSLQIVLGKILPKRLETTLTHELDGGSIVELGAEPTVAALSKREHCSYTPRSRMEQAQEPRQGAEIERSGERYSTIGQRF